MEISKKDFEECKSAILILHYHNIISSEEKDEIDLVLYDRELVK